MKYTVVIEADEDSEGFTVTVPALPGCVSEGATRDEALANIREAIIGFLEGLEKAGEPIPAETHPVELAIVAI